MRTGVRIAGGVSVHNSRFVFFVAGTLAGVDGDGTTTGGVLWMLVSRNNRPLGRGVTYYRTYRECREAVLRLRSDLERAKPVESTVDETGQWIWRIELDGEAVAVSSRSYLRARECSYNLDRFLEAVPRAAVVAGTRNGRRPGAPAARAPQHGTAHPEAHR
jgi:hypothetical protein